MLAMTDGSPPTGHVEAWAPASEPNAHSAVKAEILVNITRQEACWSEVDRTTKMDSG